jgi:hypothetical protein
MMMMMMVVEVVGIRVEGDLRLGTADDWSLSPVPFVR